MVIRINRDGTQGRIELYTLRALHRDHRVEKLGRSDCGPLSASMYQNVMLEENKSEIRAEMHSH